MGRNPSPNREYKYPQLGIRWPNEVLDMWQELAGTKYKREGGRLGRNILQQFLACHLSDEQIKKLGWFEELVSGPSLLKEAIATGEEKRLATTKKEGSAKK